MIKISKFTIRRPMFGWQPDPYSEADRQFCDSTLNMPSTGTAIDNSIYYKPISDQLSLQSCTANACADFWEAVLIKQLWKNRGMALDNAIAAMPDLSRLFLWYYGKSFMDPPKHTDINSGCFNRLIMEVIARFGVPSEKTWPYTMENACVRPSITSQREAFQRRSKAFYNIKKDTDANQMIIRALGQVPGVVFGTGIGREFFKYGGGVVEPPDVIVGYHAMVIVGYDPARSAFKVRNSWGPDWGEDGYCWMSINYISQLYTNSFWTAEPMS